MKNRHNEALLHPVPFSQIGMKPHKNRVEREGDRFSVLDVREMAEGKWAWAASVSYGPPNRPGEDLVTWRQAKAEKGDTFLRGLMEDVGEQPVLVIRPPRVVLAPWFVENDLEADDWNLVEDPHASVWMHASCGVRLPGALRFTAMHVWKTLTPAERVIVLEALGDTTGDRP